MARAKAVWGIDIGQVALKALKLREVNGQIQVEAFQTIEHATNLSQPDADRPGLIRQALEQFLEAESISGCHVAVSLSGQSGYSKFTKLPPVEAKRVPDIVRFEAEQQIPFPINEVVWRWQTFRDPDSPDVEVGLFAMKRADVAEVMSYLNSAKFKVDTLQMGPLALYNFLRFDEQAATDGATLLADVGADKTDLVVADGSRVWTRTIQIGGNNFTEALVRTFKLSFEKAEQLKRSAASSKYARQVFQAMRPVFADLVQEIQRSLGYYTSLHRDTRFRRLVGLGNGFRLPGLQKFIEQNLNVPVARIDTYNGLAPSPTVNAPALNENVLSFPVAYGLAIQGLGQAEVDINLLPGEILRHRRWVRKRPWFVAAAVVLLAALFCPGYRANQDAQTLESDADLRQARQIHRDLQKRIKTYRDIKDKGAAEVRLIQELAKLYQYRDFWLALKAMVDRSTAAVAPDQHLMSLYGLFLEIEESQRRWIVAGKSAEGTPVGERLVEFAAKRVLTPPELAALNQSLGAGEAALKSRAQALLKDVGGDPNAAASLAGAELAAEVRRLTVAQRLKRIDALMQKDKRPTRQAIVVEGFQSRYLADVSVYAPDAGLSGPGFQVEFAGRTPLPQVRANEMLARLRQYSEAIAKWYGSVAVLQHKIEWAPMSAGAVTLRPSTDGSKPTVRMPDPLKPDESMAKDSRFKITWLVAVTGDGVVMADVRSGRKYTLSQPAELLPNWEPGPDAMASAKQIKELPAGAEIEVRQVRKRWTNEWYNVRATGADGTAIGEGWVCGEALGETVEQAE